MKLYGAAMAANPRRVRIYLAEKGLEIEQVDFLPPHNELKSPEYLAKNPAGKIPLLELDDGTCISESAAIIEYFEELFPAPPMIGTNPVERAKARAIERIVAEMFPVSRAYFVNHGPSFLLNLRGLTPVPAVAEALKPIIDRNLGTLEALIGDNEFLAGPRPTVGDCHFYALMNAGIDKFDYVIPAQFPRLQRWYDNFSKRPSASAGNGGVGFRNPKDAEAPA